MTVRSQQLRVLLEKQWLTRKRSVAQNVQLFLIPIFSLIVCYLFYYVFQSGSKKGESTGVLELLFVPLGLVFLQISGVVQLVSEKAARLVETMKIMSLKSDVYYAAYAIEGVVVGLVQALLLGTIGYAMGLFNGAAWFRIFGLVWCFCVATQMVSFLIASVFDSPQNASMTAIAFYIGCIVIFFAVPNLLPVSSSAKLPYPQQRGWAMLPPIAFEFGILSFRGPPTRPKFTRPQPRSRRYGQGCGRTSNVRAVFNCPDVAEIRGIENQVIAAPVANWTLYETFGAGGEYAAYDMLPGGAYSPPNWWPGTADYFNLKGGECAGEAGVGIGACGTVSAASGGDGCVAECDKTTPAWVAINLYPRGGADQLECCCQTACACTQPSTNGGGDTAKVIAKTSFAGLPTNFCETGEQGAQTKGVWLSGTFKKKKKYTGYSGLKLEQIIAMMFASMVASCVLAWYLSQVWPSEIGARKPWYFPFLLCCPKSDAAGADDDDKDRDAEAPSAIVVEPDHRKGAETVRVHGLRKVFGTHVAVDDLRFDLHASEIFSLLGHNGAGKTTAINVLTGVLDSDSKEPDGGATIFGHAIKGDLDNARSVTGVCPQHDVLFEKLTTREHLTFFARLKGSADADADVEADQLLTAFHLSERGDHRGHELSGGMRRKLSTAIALCGQSKFVLLDEPTAGMDALARRELWDLLAAAKQDRTMLLTTHYMDEADVLGDRIGIMSHGKLQCVGSSRFLKAQYGAGYRVVCERGPESDEKSLTKFDDLIAETLPGGQRVPTLAKRKIAEPTFEATLPLASVDTFATFFHALDDKLDDLDIASYGLTITTLEEVFLAVGADETVAPKEIAEGALAIGAGRKYEASFTVQVIGITKKRLDTAPNDPKIISLVLLPFVACLVGFGLAKGKSISSSKDTQDLAATAIAAGGFLLVPALLAQQVVFERESKLRDILAVMGLDFRAYWLGTFLGDSILLSIVWLIGYWIYVPALEIPGGNGRRNAGYLHNGGIFWFPPVLTTELVLYSYALSMIFNSSKRCLIFGTGLQIIQIWMGAFIAIIISLIPGTIGDSKVQGTSWWLMPVFSPQGAFFLGLYSIPQKLPAHGPRDTWEFLLLLAIMACFYLMFVYFHEKKKEIAATVTMPDEEIAATAEGDVDVVEEREKVAAMTEFPKGGPYTLVAKRLRKVYPPKGSKATETVAVHDCSFRVAKGECFGLLGANGAGKSTCMDMIIRATPATAGNAFVDGFSTLTDFHKASEGLGVVAQHNTLWDKLSCENHLKLFARIRGVPGKEAVELVEAALDQLELRPHAKKLAQRLSGGMKRKLCVAIAIVGDPQCVLLDEPSAGLDPVSRRNLWNVIRATMDTRSVVLTSHLMDEVEALCDRVGIMVKGKLRCLGTIQHLKNSLGKHYEVELAVDPEKFAADQEASSTKVRALAADCFGPEATEEGPPNAGLFTYHVPREAMKIGDVFETIQSKKDDVGLVDYSIAQPSLEAVFIRTVLDYSGAERAGGGRERTFSKDDERVMSMHSSVEGGVDEPGDDEDLVSKKCTGCTRKRHFRICVVCWPLAILCLILALSVAGPLFVAFIIFLIAAVWGSVGLYVLREGRTVDDPDKAADAP